MRVCPIPSPIHRSRLEQRIDVSDCRSAGVLTSVPAPFLSRSPEIGSCPVRLVDLSKVSARVTAHDAWVLQFSLCV
jgi:hypothetical protein